jgi:glutamyl-tRNA(Gln) amidotransferase subunit D
MEKLPGYRGPSLEILLRNRVEVGDVVEIETASQKIVGTVVPRYVYDDEYHVVIKLGNGYNIGIDVNKIMSIRVVKKGEQPSFSVPPIPETDKDLPRVAIISTGGTIASRIDYRTGAVHPAISASELYALVPELSRIANVEPEVFASIYSENIEPEHWSRLSERIERAVMEGFSGIVVTHGTDTMGYTAAALSFALSGIPIPVVLVGAQRSSDRPSSDASMNLLASVDFASRANVSGVYVSMHKGKSDDTIAFHIGTRVRKNHTSSRDAFESIGITPAATWEDGEIKLQISSLPTRRKESKFTLKKRFDNSVSLLKFYPSMQEEIVKAVLSTGVKAVVLEGSGLGHINSKNIKHFSSFIKEGGLVFMTSQCIWGRVNMNVYETGRDLLASGVIPLDTMLPETALVKAMWSLGNSSSRDETIELMRTNIANEFLERTIE